MNPTPNHDEPSTARTDEANTLARIAEELAALDEAPLCEAELVALRERGLDVASPPEHAPGDVALVDALVRLAALREEDTREAPSPDVMREMLARVDARLHPPVLAAAAMPMGGANEARDVATRLAEVHTLESRRRLSGVVVLIAAAAAIAMTLFVVRDRLSGEVDRQGVSGDGDLVALGNDARDALQALGYDPTTASSRLRARASAWAEALPTALEAAPGGGGAG
jgi:hypothetical protein